MNKNIIIYFFAAVALSLILAIGASFDVLDSIFIGFGASVLSFFSLEERTPKRKQE